MPRETKMIELNQREAALLVNVDVFAYRTKGMKVEDEKEELRELAKTSGVEIIQEVVCHYDKPTPNLFIGSGKARELGLLVSELNTDVALFSVDLSGIQQRNLEDILGCKVIDRTQLILDIFAQHARSPEGRMQVELAQLQYLLPRLTGKGVMLSRLGGGIGTRGPGEQKLELDRRRIRRRIARLKLNLNKVHSQRALVRKKRKEEALPLVSLVGYTNSGKTTLLNSLVGEQQLADDSLFTTLDPLSRTLVLSANQRVIISDTVGFLHNLPAHLIEAFKATLEDIREADLLIHVLDVSHPLRYNYYQAVISALKEIGCVDKPMITALNKVDKLETLDWLEKYKNDFPQAVAISALRGENLAQLISYLSRAVVKNIKKVEATIPIDKMSLVDLIYREGKVESVRYGTKNVVLRVNIAASLINKLPKEAKIKLLT